MILLPIGGVARMPRMPQKPSQELAVAIAGPMVNIVIAFLLFLVVGTIQPDDLTRIDDPRVLLLARLAAVNIFLVLFNMIPAFPMDGGRVLHALLAMKLGNARATQIARGEVDLGEQILVIIPRTVHAFGDWPHFHRLGRKCDQQVMRVRLAAKPPLIVGRSQDRRLKTTSKSIVLVTMAQRLI